MRREKWKLSLVEEQSRKKRRIRKASLLKHPNRSIRDLNLQVAYYPRDSRNWEG